MDIEIREAVTADLPGILNLYSDPEIDDGDTLSGPDAEALFRRIRSYPSYAVYVAVLGDTIVGSFALLVMDNLGHSGAPSGVIEDVVVDSEYRRTGIGTAMLEHAMAQCREHGCYKVSLSADVKRDTAHRFYESLGFERHGYSFVVPLR